MTAVAPDPDRLRSAFTASLDDGSALDALRAAQEARELLPPWESHLARKALSEGATWEAIGAALGISRQAAWERLRPGIAREIRAERDRIQSERSKLREERAKRWPTKKS